MKGTNTIYCARTLPDPHADLYTHAQTASQPIRLQISVCFNQYIVIAHIFCFDSCSRLQQP